MDGAIDAATAQQAFICRIDNGIRVMPLCNITQNTPDQCHSFILLTSPSRFHNQTLQADPESFIIFRRSFGGTLGVKPLFMANILRVPHLPPRMALHQQLLDITIGVLPAILMNGIGALPQCHCRNTEILRHHDITCTAKVNQGHIHSLCPDAEGAHRAVIRNQHMAGIAQERYRQEMRLRHLFHNSHDRAGIRINIEPHSHLSSPEDFPILP